MKSDLYMELLMLYLSGANPILGREMGPFQERLAKVSTFELVQLTLGSKGSTLDHELTKEIKRRSIQEDKHGLPRP